MVSEFDGRFLAPVENPRLRESSAASESQGFRKVHADFPWFMGVRAKGDGNVFKNGHLEKPWAGVDFLAILAQSGGVEFDGNIRPRGG